MDLQYENQGEVTFLSWKLKKEDRIDQFVTNMVYNNQIVGLLPFAYSQTNQDRFIKYNISSKISLSHFLGGSLTKNRLLRLLKSITGTILEAQEYMLEDSQIMMNFDYVYVNVGSAEAELLYVPLETYQNQKKTAVFLKEILMSAVFDASENNDYVAKLLNGLNAGQEFSLVDFHKQLDELEKEALLSKTVTVQRQTTMPKAVVENPIIQKSQIQENSVKKEIPLVPQKENAILQVKTIPQRNKKSEEEKKKGWFGIKKKSDNGKKKSAVMPQTGFVIPGQTKEEIVSEIPEAAVPVKKNYSKRNEIQTCEKDFGETVVLTNDTVEPGETSLLSSCGNLAVSGAYLERRRTGEKGYITKDCYKVGKQREYVDFYIPDNSAVSRSHADVLKRQGNYYIRDNNSLNHTYVNEKILRSNEEYLLESGTTIRLADEEFVFCIY